MVIAASKTSRGWLADLDKLGKGVQGDAEATIPGPLQADRNPLYPVA
jgi:hypothetical protein